MPGIPLSSRPVLPRERHVPARSIGGPVDLDHTDIVSYEDHPVDPARLALERHGRRATVGVFLVERGHGVSAG